MGEPNEWMSIDRINNNGNYEPENCRWTNQIVQSRNTRRNDYIEYNGIVKCLSEWTLILKIPRNTLRNRLYTHNWGIIKAFETPVRKKLKHKSTT